jgi:hypothetical protein
LKVLLEEKNPILLISISVTIGFDGKFSNKFIGIVSRDILFI